MSRRPVTGTKVADCPRQQIYLPKDVLKECEDRAKEADRSLNSQLVWLIKSGLLIKEQRVMPTDAPTAASTDYKTAEV